MEKSPMLRLDLRTPLEYEQAPGLVPFDRVFPENEDSPELLFCFELDRGQAGRIDPEPACFPGELVAAGKGDGTQGNIQLSAGLYLFTQQRRLLSRDECRYLAVEQQKDGLWERLKLDNRLYIRFLFEDGSTVTQLFRPCLK